MIKVYDCSVDEIPSLTSVANGIIELLLEAGFCVLACRSGVDDNRIFLDISTFGNIGRVICGPQENHVEAIGYHASKPLNLEISNPDSLDQLIKFFKAANHAVHGQLDLR